MAEPLTAEIEEHVERLGFEVVELERAGSRARPLLRLRIDRPDASGPESDVTLEDCTRVSRALEAWLDERDDLSARYVLEVSSPGVERPLVRPRDFERFAGHEILVRTKERLEGGATRVQGELVGLRSEGEGERIVLRTAAGEEVVVPRTATTKVNLVFRWGGEGRG